MYHGYPSRSKHRVIVTEYHAASSILTLTIRWCFMGRITEQKNHKAPKRSLTKLPRNKSHGLTQETGQWKRREIGQQRISRKKEPLPLELTHMGDKEMGKIKGNSRV
jgi:hypothetical protein